MKIKYLKNWKRFVAFILIVCLILCDVDITAFTSSAENEAVYVNCTIQCKVEIVEKELSNLEVKLESSTEGEVTPVSGVYKLKVGEEYKYNITGDQIEQITGDFTIEEETTGIFQKIIYIPLENLKYSFTDTSCYVGEKISVANDWDFEWEWSSSNPDVATVSDTGEVTGVNVGSAEITRTYKTIKQTVNVTVDYKENKYKLNFYYNELSDSVDVNAMIRNQDNSVVVAEEDGTYTLLEGKEYAYTITTAGVQTTDGKKEGSFKVSEDNDEAIINIGIDFVEPVFEIQGKKLEQIDKLKSNETVKLLCTNLDELYKSDKTCWKYSFNSSSFVELKDEELELKYGQDFDLKLECAEKEIDYLKSTFDSYALKTVYNQSDQTGESSNEIEIESGVKYYIGDKEIGESDLEADKEYTITVKAEGFKEEENTVTPSLFEEKITLYTGEVKKPDIEIEKDNKLIGYSGTVIEISGVTISNYTDQLDWEWICEKKDDTSKKLSVEVTGDKDISINLEGAEAGTYYLKFQYGNVASDPITITVEKIKIDIDWTVLPEQSKYYDASAEFTITLSASDSVVLFNDVDKDSYSIEEDKILITGDVVAADVGDYKSLTISKIEAPDKYDVSGINMQVVTTVDKFKIKKANLAVKFDKLLLQYRVNFIAEGSEIKMGENSNSETLKQELFKKMGMAQNINYTEKKCTFEGVQCEEGRDSAYIDTENVRFEFAESKGIFSFEPVPEYLKLDVNDIKGIFRIKQGEKSLECGDWCTNEEITASFIEGAEYFGDNKYKEIYFCEADSNLKEVYEGDISTDSKIEIQNIGKETYYEVLFLNTNYSWSATVVAYICIIPESKKETYNSLSSINVGGRNYPVIELYFDETAPEVDFIDDRLDVNTEYIQMDSIVESKIEFRLKNTGFPVSQIEYCFVDKTESVQNNTKINKDAFVNYIKEEVESGKCTLEAVDIDSHKEQVYTIDCPKEDGDYIVVIKTVNEGGMEEYYCSNGFAVDTIPPDVKVTFIETESAKDITSEILDENKAFRNHSVIMKIDLEESHIDVVEVSITAKDSSGKDLFSVEGVEYERALKCTAYDKDKKITCSSCEIKLEQDANYQIEITAIDKAGNASKQDDDGQPQPEVYNVTVDKTVPNIGKIETALLLDQIKSNDGKKKGIVAMLKNISVDLPWSTFVSEILYNVFSKDEIKYIMSGSDEISPVEISYYLSDGQMTEDNLEALPEESWHLYDEMENNIIEVNKDCIIYERVKDKAGNVSYFCTDGMITDNHKPDISIALNKEANKNGFYNGNVSFSADIEDKIPEGGTASSGLQYVSYYLEKDGKHTSSKVIYDISENRKKETDTLKIEKESISAKEFNSNDVTLCVTAVDNAGNKNTEEIPLKIDNVKPEISVTYDDQAGEEYCNHTRTATITIKERNLNTDDVKIVAKGNHGNKGKVGKWSHSSDIGKSDDAVYTCKVTFTEDDDYEFTVSCVDKAGNKAKQNFSDKFTIDVTKPVISVSYNGTIPEQNAYYNEPITATITITEHNFNAGKVDVQMHADNSSVSGISGFSSNGDVHTATVSCNADGIYRLDVAYTDEAGNAADSYNGNTFTVDLIEPEIEITNIQDKSANKGDVKPVITCTDVNYDSDKVAIKLYGANNGEIDLNDVSVSSQAINNGEEFTLDFPKTQILDDVYTLTAKVTDKAGNETEKSIEFSVNRFGSVYTLGTETGEWLTNGVCSYVQEGRPVVIVETNVDEVVERNIAYTQGGVNAAVVTVNEVGSCSSQERENGTYYQMKDKKDGNQWYQYEYTISADNFLSEGRYSVQIDSTDKAGNHTSNVSNKHSEGNLVVEFAVDQTAPSAVITGAENREVYNETSHTVYLDVQDNLATDYVTVYLNGEEYGTYKAADIEELEDGLIPVKVGQSLSTQTIQLMAKDMAGNILSEKSEGKYDKTFDDFHIIVTTNPLVRFLHTTWLWLLLLVIFAVGGISIVIIVRQKKMQQ